MPGSPAEHAAALAAATNHDLTEHAQEFTDIEVSVLDPWLDAENDGLDERARKILDTGLQWEHYTANLSHVASERTPEQIAQQAIFQNRFFEQVRLLKEDQDKLPPKPDGSAKWMPYIDGLRREVAMCRTKINEIIAYLQTLPRTFATFARADNGERETEVPPSGDL